MSVVPVDPVSFNFSASPADDPPNVQPPPFSSESTVSETSIADQGDWGGDPPIPITPPLVEPDRLYEHISLAEFLKQTQTSQSVFSPESFQERIADQPDPVKPSAN